MTELQKFMLLSTAASKEGNHLAEVTAQRLVAQEESFTGVVRSLSEYIKEDDANIRDRAVSYLTAVIKVLPPGYLSRQQIHILASFYCQQLDAESSIVALQSLQSLDRFDNVVAALTIQGLFQHTSFIQSRSQAQRFQVLRLLYNLMFKHRQALLDMKDKTITGITELVGRERDPRNLMLVFTILRVLIVEWDISHYVELLFDSVYKYFPVAFKPHPNDPYNVTVQDLKNRLQDCLSSNEVFAPHVFPALLDKLDANSFSVKDDALNALKACVLSYAPSTLTQYSITIWNSLKFEILHSQDEVIAAKCITILRLLAERLSIATPIRDNKSPLVQYLEPVLRDCNDQLAEPNQKQATLSRRILTSLSSVSLPALKFVTESAIPPLLQQFHKLQTPGYRAFLDTLNGIFDSAISVFGTWLDSGYGEPAKNPLSEYKTRLGGILDHALMNNKELEVSSQIAALSGVKKLCILRRFLSDVEIELYVRYLCDRLLGELPSNELRSAIISTLADISTYKPTLIEAAIPWFFANLPESISNTDAKYILVLENLSQISIEPGVFNTFVRGLLNKLEMASAPGEVTNAAYPRSILMAILYAAKRMNLNEDPNLDWYYGSIVRDLCKRAALATIGNLRDSIWTDYSVLDTLGQLCCLIIHSLPISQQQSACDNVYCLFSPAEAVPATLHTHRTSYQRRCLILSTYFLAALPKDIVSQAYDVSELVKEFARLAVSEHDPPMQSALLRHLALLVNKFLSCSELGSANAILFSLSCLERPQSKMQVIRTIFWLSKALILRLSPTSTEILPFLVGLLASPDPAIRDASSKGFRILLCPDEILTVENGANVRLLAGQRVFNTVIPLISEKINGIRNEEPLQGDDQQSTYLTTLCGILSTIPPALTVAQAPILFPLLVRSLEIQRLQFQTYKAISLDALTMMIQRGAIDAIGDLGCIENLTMRLLEVTAEKGVALQGDHNPPSNDASELRRRAVRCLSCLAESSYRLDGTSAGISSKLSLPLHVRRIVLKSLKLALDDPNRNVRAAAVSATSVWHKQKTTN